MSESTQGCRSTINTINSKVKNTAKKWFHAIKAAFVYKKNGLREPAELPCLPPLKRADTDMITTRDLAAWAAQNQHTACTALTGGTPSSSEEESRRQNESHEWATFLYRRRGFSDDIMLVETGENRLKSSENSSKNILLA